MTATRSIAAIVLALGWLTVGIPPASADRPDQVQLGFGFADGEIFSSTSESSAGLDRDHDDLENVFGGVVACRSQDPTDLSVAGFLRNPDKVLDLSKKVQLEQSSNLHVRFFSVVNGEVEGVVPSCKAKLTVLDKNKNGAVPDDFEDQVSWSLKCGKDLPTALGLNQAQTDEFLERFGEKMKCSGKGPPVNNCFRGDTLVATAAGLRPIRDVRVGDRVWSWDEKREQNVLRRVSRLYRKPAGKLRTLRVGDETLYTTDEHPYWVDGRGWTRAADLAAGDHVRTQQGRRLTLLANERVSDEQFYAGYTEPGVRPAALGNMAGGLVYNIEVEDTHTFYVGAQRILVHNK